MPQVGKIETRQFLLKMKVSVNRKFVISLMFYIAIASGFCSVNVYADSTIPVADFYKRSAYGQPILSPDGANLAVLTARDGRLVLAVINIDSRQSTVIASDPDWSIASPMWVNNQRLVYSISKGKDATMQENKGGGLFAVNRDGSEFRKLTITLKEAEGGGKYSPVRVLRRVGGDSNDLYVSNNERSPDDELGATDVYRMDTTNGRKKLLTFNNPGRVSDWLIDHADVIRVASGVSVDPKSKRIKQSVYYRDGEKADWKLIYEAFLDEGKAISPLGFDFDNRTLLVAGRFNGRDKEGLHVWDFSKNTAGELLADHNEVDIGESLIVDIDRRKVVGIQVDGMRSEMYYFDKDYAQLQATLDASFPGEEVSFVWRGNRAVVVTRGDNNVGKAFLFDTKKKTLEQLLVFKPELEGKRLSKQEVISYSARDGMNIPAYLTLPEGRPTKALPLIAYIHGGPHARDEHGYHPDVQMFASRGYAVLQPQFRMSTGFGWKHHTAGWKQWGLSMQDDITDGVGYLVKQGIVDPKRVCIVGASYGGYATMYGLIKDPDLYQCGVNIVGVTDVKMLFTVAWSDMSESYMDNLGALMHGDPKTDDAYFRKVSAIENASKIKTPVMMAYGSEDVRVPLIHGEKMRDALLKQGNTVDWMVMVGEGHGWSKEANNMKFGQAMLDFVDRYIGDQSPTQKGKK